MSEPSIKIEWLGGNCPVQAEGTINGLPFYFRSRGDEWSMSVGGADVIGSPEWYHEEQYGVGPYDAGWMPDEDAYGFIMKAAKMFHDAQKTPTP